MLPRQDVYYRRNASKVLAAISPNCEEAIPVLINALTEEDVSVNWYSAVALGKIGPAAKEAVPGLVELLRSDRARISYMGPGKTDRILNPGRDRAGDAAVFALERIDPDLGAKERARWSELVHH
jgi:HEAT repeat protein